MRKQGKKMREYSKLTVTEKAEKSIKNGHPWVYGEEVLACDKTYENGSIVDVCSKNGKWLGSGFVNDNSKIRVRLISDNTNDKFDDAFWYRRLKYAVDYRKTVMPGNDFKCCRLIFGEADRFPGFTVDRFENVLVVQILSLGIEKIKKTLISGLVDILEKSGVVIDCVYERNDVSVRKLEGLEEYKDYYTDGIKCNYQKTVRICENGIYFDVDFINGQKTGYFLDQKYNRSAVARIAGSKKVLDCFTHTGAFALNALMGGADKVTAIDISDEAIQMTKNNALINGVYEKNEYICADVFDYLTEAVKAGKSDYDFIILDPPAFTKSRSTVKDAYRGYKEINMKAMRLLPRGGYLATCSCSHFMPPDMFCKMLHDAAIDARVNLRQIEARQQSPDHPILMGVPETEYLKFYLFQVV